MVDEKDIQKLTLHVLMNGRMLKKLDERFEAHETAHTRQRIATFTLLGSAVLSLVALVISLVVVIA